MENLGLWIALGILGLIVLWFIAAYNGLISWRNAVKNAWSQIDVQLKRRYDLIPNLVNTVKGYAKHEQQILENVTKARSACLEAKTPKDQMNADNMLTGTLKTLFAVAENYPELKANQNFLALQEELSSTENKISFARQFYNDTVMTYNTKLQSIPTNIIASICSFTAEAFWQTPEAERQNVKVEF
ncbi:MAG: LemA family protein [Planctomycetes bacterium]|nr:LemA family protein [Planctomycetota bacterium]